MRHEMLTQHAPFCIGVMAKKGTLSRDGVRPWRIMLKNCSNNNMLYAAILGIKLYLVQVKFYYADTMLTRASHVTYHVTNVAMPNCSQQWR